MTTFSLRLPESHHRGVKELAKQDGISINQFIAVAVAEEISALATEEYIRKRARRASRAKFEGHWHRCHMLNRTSRIGLPSSKDFVCCLHQST
jgi:hypothetical protein